LILGSDDKDVFDASQGTKFGGHFFHQSGIAHEDAVREFHAASDGLLVGAMNLASMAIEQGEHFG
jgi:hypothetical protein